MTYYRDSVTEKSWQFLMDLKRKFRFVLIGGWAVWFYTRQLKSKDIDITVDLPVLDKLKSAYEIDKNQRLKKYQLRRGEVEVDIYVPYFSNPGIPAEKILTNPVVVEGFHLPPAEVLLALKLVAWSSRKAGAKGRKDFLDIISLLRSGKVHPEKVKQIITENNLTKIAAEIKTEISASVDISEFGINRHQLSKSKKLWLSILS